MSNSSEPPNNNDDLRERLIGLGESSHRKSYYPELQRRLGELERFKAFLDHSNDAIFLIEVPSARVVDVNEACCRQLGWSRQELLEKSVFDISDLQRNRLAEGLICQSLDGGEEDALVETTLLRRSGERFPAEMNLSRKFFQETESSYVIAVARNITKRKRAEEALKKSLVEAQESRDKIDTILKSVADGLIVADMKNRVVMMNRTAMTWLGVATSQVVNRPLEAIPAAGPLRDQVSATLEGKAARRPVELELIDSRSHRPLLVQARTSLVRGKGGRTSGTITTLRDVTRERDLDRMKSDFISTAAHELNTPLTLMMGYAEILMTQEDIGGISPLQQKEFLETIYHKGEGLAKIIEDLLYLSSLEFGRVVPVNREPCVLGAKLRRLVDRYREAFPGYSFELVLPKVPLDLWVDKEKMVQVLDNLLSNAVKFSPEGSRVEVACELSETAVTVAVGDEGIGMTEEQAEKIFDKFYRVDSSTTAKAGLGLGMTMVKSIVEAHGGSIWVQSSPGKGTTVSFTIPLTCSLAR